MGGVKTKTQKKRRNASPHPSPLSYVFPPLAFTCTPNVYDKTPSLRGRPQKGWKIKMSARGRRDGLQRRYSFVFFVHKTNVRILIGQI